MTARQWTLNAPAAIFFIADPFDHGHYTIVIMGSHLITCTVTTLLRPRSLVMDRAYWPSGKDSGTENVMFLLSTPSPGNLVEPIHSVWRGKNATPVIWSS